MVYNIIANDADIALFLDFVKIMQYLSNIPKDMLWSSKVLWDTLKGVVHVN
jgi:hypothetical protein